MNRTRFASRLLVFAPACLGYFGCASVKPQPDIDRARQLAQERTGSNSIYDPQTEESISERVDALLEGGLSVEEAVQVGLLNNRELQAAFQSIGMSHADLVQAGLLTNPSISLIGKLPEGGGRTDLDFGFSQELADLWQIPIRKHTAKLQLKRTILEVAQRAIDIAADVRSRSYELLALQQAEATTRESLGVIEESLHLADQQFQAGAVGQLDVNLARNKVIDVRLELLSIERERHVAEITLARLLGLSSHPKLWTLHDKLPATDSPGDLQLLVDQAMSQRLDAQMAEFDVKAAESELKQQYWKIFPSVVASFELERNERRALPGRNILADTVRDSLLAGTPTAPTIQSKAERQLERRQIIDAKLGPAVAITLPIWDQNQAQIAKACFKAQQRRKEYEALLDRVASQVEQAFMTAENAAALVRLYQGEALPQSRENMDAARRLYQAGQQGILILNEFENSFILRQRGYVRALGDSAIARSELERAVGGKLKRSTQTQPASGPAASP